MAFLGIGTQNHKDKRKDDQEPFPVSRDGWRDSRLVNPNTVDVSKLPSQIKSGDPTPGGQNPQGDDDQGEDNE